MPLPRAVARLNKRYTNRLIEPIVRRFAGFAVVAHTGRRSGTTYRTPVYAFECDGAIVVPLTYGSRSDWVQNVLVHNGVLRLNGIARSIGAASIVDRVAAWHCLPPLVRLVLKVMRVHEFLRIEDRLTPLTDHST